LTLGPTVPPVRSGETLPAAAAASASAGPRVLQTGIFNREENARAMAARLAARGFTADVSQKPVNGLTHWTVTIPAGENANQTMLKLKDAGFESFPVF
jgi:cell division protein FtsN